jgi:Raf kinase inhibitor-like YbhB/YbcL family protein
MYNETDHVALTDNRNPQLSWSDLPADTLSLVLICCDSTCPTSGDQVNKEGVTVPADLPRTDFYHWVMVDIPSTTSSMAEGEFSNGVTPHGKSQDLPLPARHGLNNYTDWFADDSEMKGKYFGYDGPCPPWNDELIHHYHFTLYALDVDQCPIKGDFRAADVLEAMEGHILAQASITGAYAINPDAVNPG